MDGLFLSILSITQQKPQSKRTGLPKDAGSVIGGISEF
jgi:hypothetical protein